MFNPSVMKVILDVRLSLITDVTSGIYHNTSLRAPLKRLQGVTGP